MPDLEFRLNQRVGSVQFLITDNDSETTVTLLREDDVETCLRKLRKVLELAEPAASAFDVQVKGGAMVPRETPKPDLTPAGPPPPLPDWLKSVKTTPDVLPEGVELYGEGEE